jgi:ABC-type lipoprotein release transport system permease subunit
MSLAWTITRRYLFAKKSHHLINVISWISVLGVAVGTFGLVVVLSVFNGFGNLVMEMYNSFDPDIKIQMVSGRSFEPTDKVIQSIRKASWH